MKKRVSLLNKKEMKALKHFIYRTVLALYKILPFKRGVCKLIRISKIPNNAFYKDLKFTGPFIVPVSGNKKFRVYHHGGTIENETFWKGLFASWENDTGWIWLQLCPHASVIFDIGANTGIYSLVAKTINPNCRVFAFEPSNNTFQKLQLNNRMNSFNTVCEKIALSSVTGEQVFYDVPEANQTSASLSADKLKNWEEYHGEIIEYKVPTMTLGDYIQSRKIDTIDLIKIDVEMYEPEVIKGLGDYLYAFKPVIVIEILNEKVADELNGLLQINEFELFHLQENGKAVRQASFSAHPYLWNFIFFHKSIADKVKQYTTLYS